MLSVKSIRLFHSFPLDYFDCVNSAAPSTRPHQPAKKQGYQSKLRHNYRP